MRIPLVYLHKALPSSVSTINFEKSHDRITKIPRLHFDHGSIVSRDSKIRMKVEINGVSRGGRAALDCRLEQSCKSPSHIFDTQWYKRIYGNLFVDLSLVVIEGSCKFGVAYCLAKSRLTVIQYQS